MRVIDQGCLEESIMGKKKKRQILPKIGENRKVSENSTSEESGLISADVSDVQINGAFVEETELLAENSALLPKKCVHLKSGVNPTSVKKKLKQFSRRCEQCEKLNVFDENEVVWICLNCGHRGCGRYSTNQHALKHFETPRSVQHSLVYNLNTSQIWCYNCDVEIPADASSQLKTSLNEIQTRLSVVGPETPKLSSDSAKPRLLPFENSSKSKSTKDKTEKHENLPDSVKGLSNLGNTCFFNSVVQNLIQTQQLDEILDSGRLVKGEKVVIKPSPIIVENSSSTDSTTEEQKMKEIPPLTVTLNEDPGALTQSLCSIFKEFKTSKSSVITPNNLFSQVCKKAPRFKGFQQQDSHELLRYLLDALREEEKRRLRFAVMHSMDLPKKVVAESLSAFEKQKMKAYDRAAEVTCVEQVFGGELLQCITCLECKNVSQRHESFLDLSLPIVENKEIATVVERLSDDFLKSLETPKKTYGGKSKHLMKKEKKVARKNAKGQLVGGRRKSSSEQIIPLVDETAGNQDSSESAKIENTVDEAIVIESLENCTLEDDTTEDADDSKCDENETDADVQEKKPAQESNQFMEPLNSSEEQKHGVGCNLAACLREFMSSETLTGKNKFGCEFCSKAHFSETKNDVVSNENGANKPKIKLIYTDALKQYIIYSPPAVLTLHLKRFHQIGGSFRKISKHVEFPVILDLSPYCSKKSKRVSPNCNRVLYSLYGVVSHSGRLSGGHYVAYVKIREKTKNNFTSTFLQSMTMMTSSIAAVADVDYNKNSILSSVNKHLNLSVADHQPSNDQPSMASPPVSTLGRWYYISDSHVSETSEVKVLSSEAYLLFYERFQ